MEKYFLKAACFIKLSHHIFHIIFTFNGLKKVFVFLQVVWLGWGVLQAQETININSTAVLLQQGRLPGAFAGSAIQYRCFEANPQLKNLSQSNAGDTLLLDFFANHRYRATVQSVDRSCTGITGITARIVGIPWGYCFVSASDRGVSISAELPLTDNHFSVVYINGQSYLLEQKLSEIQPGQHEQHPDAPDSQDTKQPVRLGIVPAAITTPTRPESSAAATVDMLVVYTPAAKAWTERNGKNIDDMINQAIQRANLVMGNSQTNVTVKLVHSQAVAYTESASLNTDLGRLRSPSDGYADEAHALRSRYGADLTLLLLDDVASGVAGAGYILADEYGNPASGFSVVKVSNIDNSYTFIHEVGHNFGCGHHTDTDNNGLYAFSHGWRNTTAGFSTVMTYEIAGCPRIPYFSDPNITYNGVAVGSATANNAGTIRRTKGLIAAYSNDIPHTDAFLRNITVSSGTLVPAFNPGIRNYTVTVGNSVTNIDVTGIANSSYAAVNGNVAGKALITGDNKVEITVDDDWGNYPGGKGNVYTVTVTRQNASQPKPPAVVFPAAAPVTYSPAQKLANIALTGGSGDGDFAWATPSTVPTAANSGYDVVFTPRDAANYDYSGIVLRRTVQLTVHKAVPPAVTFPAAAPVTYSPAQKLSNIALTGGSGDGTFAWAAPNTVPTAANSGYDVVFTPRDAANYDYSGIVLRRTVQLTVHKAGQNIDFPAIPDKNTGDVPFNVNAAADTGLPLTYSSDAPAVAEISASGTVTVKSAGTATITVRQAGNENYAETSLSRTFTVQTLTSAGDTEAGNGFLLYPNPVNRSAFIQVKTDKTTGMQGNITVYVYHISGSLIRQFHLEDGISKLQAPNVPGIYLYVLKTKDMIIGTQRVTVL